MFLSYFYRNWKNGHWFMIDSLKQVLCLFEDIVAKREKSNHFLIFDGASITCMRSVKCMTSNKKHIQVQKEQVIHCKHCHFLIQLSMISCLILRFHCWMKFLYEFDMVWLSNISIITSNIILFIHKCNEIISSMKSEWQWKNALRYMKWQKYN